METDIDMLNELMNETPAVAASSPVVAKTQTDDPKFAQLATKVPSVSAALKGVNLALQEVFKDLSKDLSVRVDMSIVTDMNGSSAVAKIKRVDIKRPTYVDHTGQHIDKLVFQNFEKRAYTKVSE